jgi:hypothetical protein
MEIVQSARANIWDAFFVLLSNMYFVLYPYAMAFVLLVLQVSVTNTSNKHTFLRHKDRYSWWFSRVIIIICTSLLYTTLVIVGIALTASSVLTWSSSWSDVIAIAAIQEPRSWATPWLTSHMPFDALLQAVVLLYLGTVAFGLLVQTGVVFTGRPIFGALIAIFVILATVFVNNYGLTDNLPNIFVHMHWVLVTHNASFSVAHSLCYWIVIILLLTLIGWWRTRRMDILS